MVLLAQLERQFIGCLTKSIYGGILKVVSRPTRQVLTIQVIGKDLIKEKRNYLIWSGLAESGGGVL